MPIVRRTLKPEEVENLKPTVELVKPNLKRPKDQDWTLTYFIHPNPLPDEAA